MADSPRNPACAVLVAIIYDQPPCRDAPHLAKHPPAGYGIDVKHEADRDDAVEGSVTERKLLGVRLHIAGDVGMLDLR